MYYLDDTRAAVISFLSSSPAAPDGVRGVILFGAPGTGKTSLGRHFARSVGAEVIYYLCHHWTSDCDLFSDIDVGEVVVGTRDKENVYQPGALLRAVKASWQGAVVLIIDELDKAPERVDALLLEFLQTGRVYDIKGRAFEAVRDRLYVFITSNETRPLSEPLLRRCMRVWLGHLPTEVEASVLHATTQAPRGLCKVVAKTMARLRREGVDVSLSEGQRLLAALRACDSYASAQVVISGWLMREPPATDEGRRMWREVVSAIWAEANKVGWRAGR